MSKCSNCGTTLREGAGFCSACGQAVSKAVFCSNCGTELDAGDKFCFACGAAVKGTDAPAEAPKRRGRPPKSEAAKPAKKKVSYPDISGFYNCGYHDKIVCASERAIVFSDNSRVYRIDKDLNMRTNGNLMEVRCVAQTADGIYAVKTRWNSDIQEEQLVLQTLSDELQVLDEKLLCDLPGYEETDYYCYKLTGDAFFLIHQIRVENDEGKEISADISFTRFDLESGEKTVLDFDQVLVEGGWLTKIDTPNRVFADGSKLYFWGDVRFFDTEEEDDDEGALLCLDFDTEEFTLLWHGDTNLGIPRFFDFKKGIMWTHPREMECKRRGWETYGALPLVARKIAPNAPILTSLPIWKEVPRGDSAYFDGEKAYFAPSYYQFHALDREGNKSEDWNGTGHGRTETAVVWQNKVIMDLKADYWYTAYPAGFDKPNWESEIDMRTKEIQ